MLEWCLLCRQCLVSGNCYSNDTHYWLFRANYIRIKCQEILRDLLLLLSQCAYLSEVKKKCLKDTVETNKNRTNLYIKSQRLLSYFLSCQRYLLKEHWYFDALCFQVNSHGVFIRKSKLCLLKQAGCITLANIS